MDENEMPYQPELQPIGYVTFDPVTGDLTGSYLQMLQLDHADTHLQVDETMRADWTAYRANAARNGLELRSVVVPPAVAPVDAIPMLNLHLVLIDDGHLQAVEQTIAAMPGEDGQRARAYWAKALTARRDNELVNTLWPSLYDDEAAFDEAWARAAALNP